MLVPFLRDTLVGLNYAYYEPPGAQILHNNPLFVRSHDFSGEMAMGGEQSWRVPHVFGSGLPAGGGAHLAGSLADLPFVLAEAEQDFIVPENVQALIWHELVPGLVCSATLPRWWGVTPERIACRGSLSANWRGVAGGFGERREVAIPGDGYSFGANGSSTDGATGKVASSRGA